MQTNCTMCWVVKYPDFPERTFKIFLIAYPHPVFFPSSSRTMAFLATCRKLAGVISQARECPHPSESIYGHLICSSHCLWSWCCVKAWSSRGNQGVQDYDVKPLEKVPNYQKPQKKMHKDAECVLSTRCALSCLKMWFKKNFYLLRQTRFVCTTFFTYCWIFMKKNIHICSYCALNWIQVKISFFFFSLDNVWKRKNWKGISLSHAPDLCATAKHASRGRYLLQCASWQNYLNSWQTPQARVGAVCCFFRLYMMMKVDERGLVFQINLLLC